MSLIKRREGVALATVLESPLFEGMTAQYLREVYDGLAEEKGEETANNWAHCVQLFGPDKGSEFDLDSMGFGDDLDGSDLDGVASGGVRDPLRVATLVQSNTKVPRGVEEGWFFDKLTDEVLAQTVAENAAGKPTPTEVPGAVLVYHQARTLFKEDSKRPECWSKDGTINRFGGLCKVCPHVKTLTCTNQIIFVWANEDFSRIFKINFSKTGLTDARAAVKRLRATGMPFANISHLSVVAAENNRGSWWKPSVAVTKNKCGEWQGKAFRVLAELYRAYFGTVKQSLKERHVAYQKNKGAGVPGGVAPGSLPQGPGVKRQIGAGDAFMSTGKTDTAHEESHPDVESLVGGKKPGA